MTRVGLVNKRLYDALMPEADTAIIKEVCLGRAYTAVCLEDGRMGLSAMPLGNPDEHPPEYTGSGCVGPLLAHLLDRGMTVAKSLALAAANALISPAPDGSEEDTLHILALQPEDRVAMVGLFPTLVPQIRQTGATLTVIENDASKYPLLSSKERKKALKACTVALITATTLLNDTMEALLNDLGQPRSVSILGPSTPLLPDIYRDTPITHLGGSAINDPVSILSIIARGGGTPAMRPYLRFVNYLLQTRT